MGNFCRVTSTCFTCTGETATHIAAAEGQDIQLQCPGNETNSRVAWWKMDSYGNKRIVFNGAVQHDFADDMFFDKTSGILTIHKAKLNDSGMYYCSVGFDEAHEIHLSVLGKYQLQK